MKLLLDKYAYLNSYIHLWQPQPKFIALISLIFAFTFVQNIVLLPLIISLTLILYLSSNLPLNFLLSHLRYPGIFIIAVVILLPFLVGKTVIFSFYILTIKREGCLLVILIATRFICVLTTSLVLFATSPFLTTLNTLKSLGLSPIISDMMLLTYRYLEEFGDRLITMERGLRLKGFHAHRLNRRNLKIIANLMGSLLVRSYDQSKLVYQAMILRGYGHNSQLVKKKPKPTTNLKHWLACFVVVFISLMIVVLNQL
ncbi:transmembrane component NikQ of energizing module of nickel ECF transporter [Geminocystis sp. NIES-3708]|uniref:cobalt ECF transporter T component CbiQ n=1 Tax=Geminocystis sp. NIES-3708 TaxID=1615909 RepID=UPI0005FC4507|nr:cobalt ECF transporter T component CbiQ [Geminocystis sp. NIES-3708]BAQ60292.1 transmembrane component NikQ of energizing module of nickel ECF transporter [Geminocystis sp. NIES-3708]